MLIDPHWFQKVETFGGAPLSNLLGSKTDALKWWIADSEAKLQIH